MNQATPTPEPAKTPEPAPIATPEPKVEGKEPVPLAAQKKDEPVGAPEKYEAFKAPEGYEVDAKVLTEAEPLFKSLNLSQTQAQQLVDFYSKASTDAADAAYNSMMETRKGWRDGIIKDPTLGNGTDNLKPEVLATIGRAIDSLPNAAEFREAMALTGAGDNPAFVKAFYELSKRVGEGTSVRGAGPSPGGQRAPGAQPASAAQAIWPKLGSGS